MYQLSLGAETTVEMQVLTLPRATSADAQKSVDNMRVVLFPFGTFIRSGVFAAGPGRYEGRMWITPTKPIGDVIVVQSLEGDKAYRDRFREDAEQLLRYTNYGIKNWAIFDSDAGTWIRDVVDAAKFTGKGTLRLDLALTGDKAETTLPPLPAPARMPTSTKVAFGVTAAVAGVAVVGVVVAAVVHRKKPGAVSSWGDYVSSAAEHQRNVRVYRDNARAERAKGAATTAAFWDREAAREQQELQWHRDQGVR